MRALIYCYRSGWLNNALGLALAGIVARPLTCPPLTAETFPYERLAEVDLVYIALHGSPKARVLRGDNEVAALSLARLEDGPRLERQPVVILEGCYQAETRFPAAFLAKGARAVFASPERTFDRRLGLGTAGKAGLEIVRRLQAGRPPDAAARDSGFVAFADRNEINGHFA